jgi:hypothetical protein
VAGRSALAQAELPATQEPVAPGSAALLAFRLVAQRLE